jgi:hypothetical protein
VGRFTKTIFFTASWLGALFALYKLVNHVIPDYHSRLFSAVVFAVMCLATLGFKRLQRRWPAAISDDALMGGGPRLTFGRAVIGTGLLLLWTSVMVMLFITYRLDVWQTALIWVAMLAGLLWTVNLLERRWLQRDARL